jgi:dTDP-4-amino-4,6-dideoxygalactose transaminase
MAETLAIFGGNKIVQENMKTNWPIITKADEDAVMGVIKRGILFGAYAPEVSGLQDEFARYVGTKYCIAMNSGTATLHAAVMAAGAGPGDEVITTAFSFLATAVAALHHNAIPIFVDIRPDIHTIDPAQIEAKITEKTKAIIPVHIQGQPADMDEIMAIAKKYNLAVIEDACQSHGATYKDKMSGSIGDMGCFSTNATKNHPGGEGGLFVTDSEALRGRANMVRMFGEFVKPSEGRNYKAYTMGWHYRTQEMAAAFARSQLKTLPEHTARSQRNGKFLVGELAKINGVVPPVTLPDRTHVYHKFRVRLEPKKLGVNDMPELQFRELIRTALRAEGVDAVLWQTIPLPGQPLFQLREGYGSGCPWTCPHARNGIVYDVNDYPETVRLLNNSIVICSEMYPIFAQNMEVMEAYVAAFRKVFDNLDELLDKKDHILGRKDVILEGIFAGEATTSGVGVDREYRK